jgi:hypothetical protein
LLLLFKVCGRYKLIRAGAGHSTGWTLALWLVPVLVVLAGITEPILTARKQQKN